MIILLNACNNSVKKDLKINNQLTLPESQKENALIKKIDSLKNFGFTIYKSFNFMDMEGIELSKDENILPLLAYKKEKDSINMFSIFSSKIIVRRCIKKDSNSNMIERTKEILFSDEEFFQSNYIFKYEKGKVIVFDFKENIEKVEGGNFFLGSVYFFYRDSTVRYYSICNQRKMLQNTDIKYEIDESQLEKVFSNCGKIEKKVYHNKLDYKSFKDRLLLNYLMKYDLVNVSR